MTQHIDQRLHGLDAVRGLALVAGVVLHAAMSFLPGPQIWVVADASRSTTLSVAFFAIHMARMTVFFVLAGFFARLVFHHVGWAGFVRNRFTRIAIPLVVGWPMVYGAILVLAGAATPGSGGVPTITAATFPLAHLWFLYLLLVLYAMALPLRAAVTVADRRGSIRTAVDTAMRWTVHPWAAALLAVPAAAALYFHPYWFQWFGVPTPDAGLIPNRAAVISYGFAFGFGWLLQRQASVLLPRLQRSWAVNLAVAVAATVACLAMSGTEPLLAPAPFGPVKLKFAAVYSIGLWGWTLALIGLGLRFLNGHSPVRRYLADASYWIYLAHLPLVMALQLLVRDWPLAWPVKFIAIVAIATTLLLLSYHWLVRPTAIGALLNGRRHPRTGATISPKGTTSMKALPLLLLFPALLPAQAVVPPAALPLDTVIARHVATSGPLAQYQSRRTSMRVTGMAPFEIPVVAEAMRPNLLLKQVTLQGATQVTGYDGRAAWRIDPFVSASGKPADVPAAELDDLIEEADFDGPIINATAKGNRLRYLSPRVVSVAGRPTPVHTVELTFANGRQSVIHLHATSYREVLRTQSRPVMGRDVEMTITPSDWRTVQGVPVPHLMEIVVPGLPEPIRVRIDSVAFGVQLDRRQFNRP